MAEVFRSPLQPVIGLCQIAFNQPPFNPPERCRPIRSFLAFTPWYTPRLGVDEKYTIYLEEAIRGKTLAAADISIRIDYYPWFLTFWPFKGSREQRF
jgi:hypothetical protein